MKTFGIGFAFLLCFSPFALGQGLVLEQEDFNYEVGTDTHFHHYTNLDLAGSLLPFDPQQSFWDFSSLAAGGDARVQLVDPATTPYAGSFPGATGTTVQNVPGTPTAYLYEQSSGGLHEVLGFGTYLFPFNVTAVYNPPWEVYSFPMAIGDTSSQFIQYSYRLGLITVNVNESHNYQVVAEGMVKVPGFPYAMPCLVMHEYVTIQDNFGTNDNFHGYYWLVADGFSGANGVAAVQSNTNAGLDFTVCRNAFFLGQSTLQPEGTSLQADSFGLYQSTGGIIQFELDAGTQNAGRPYYLLDSGSGTWPGTVLPGGAVLELNWDFVTDHLMTYLNGSMYQAFRGNLDGNGKATAILDTGGSLPPGISGMTIYFAFTTENPYDFQSNVVLVKILP